MCCTCMALFQQKSTHADLVASLQQLQARLQHFDKQLPKYQHCTAQLTDLLQVRALDDVVPAVQRLIKKRS